MKKTTWIVLSFSSILFAAGGHQAAPQIPPTPPKTAPQPGELTPFSDPQSPLQVYTTGLPKGITQFAQAVPHEETLNMDLFCLGNENFLVRSLNRAEIQEGELTTYFPIDWEAYRYTDKGYEKLDLEKIKARYEQNGDKITGFNLLGKGKVASLSVLSGKKTSSTILVNLKTGEPYLANEFKKLLREGEQWFSNGTPSRNGRFMAFSIAKGTDNFRTGILLVDFDKNSVRRVPVETKKVQWISNDGNYFLSKDNAGVPWVFGPEGGQPIFPTPSSGMRIRDAHVLNHKDGKSGFVQVETANNELKTVRFSFSDGRVLESHPVPNPTVGASANDAIPMWNGRYTVFQSENPKTGMVMWHLKDSHSDQMIASAPGPLSSLMPECSDGGGNLTLASTIYFSGGRNINQSSLYQLNETQFLHHLIGSPQSSIEALSNKFYTKNPSVFAEAAIEMRARKMDPSLISDPKFKGRNLKTSEIALLKAPFLDQHLDSHNKRKEAYERLKTMLAEILPSVYEEKVKNILEPLQNDSDDEVKWRAKDLVQFYKNNGKVTESEIRSRLASLDY